MKQEKEIEKERGTTKHKIERGREGEEGIKGVGGKEKGEEKEEEARREGMKLPSLPLRAKFSTCLLHLNVTSPPLTITTTTLPSLSPSSLIIFTPSHLPSPTPLISFVLNITHLSSSSSSLPSSPLLSPSPSPSHCHKDDN